MKQSRKRNYVRKRRYLQRSINQIKEAIDFLHSAKGEPVDEEQSLRQATIFAQRIEAVCWSSHSPITADGYQQSMETKTNELIFTLLQKEVPNMDSTKIQKIIVLLNIYRSQFNKTTDAKAEGTKEPSQLSSQKKYSSSHSESTPNASVLTFLTQNLCADSAVQKTNQISTQSPSFDTSNPNSSPIVMKPASSLPVPLLNQLTVEQSPQIDQIKPPGNDFLSQIDQIKPPENGFLSQIDQIKPPENGFLSQIDQIKPPENGFLSQIDQIKPSGNDFLSQINQIKPPENGFLSQIDQIKPPGNDFLSQIDQIKPPGNDFLSQIDQIKPPENDFLSQIDQIKPPENDFLSQLIHSNIYTNIDPSIPRDITTLGTFLNDQTPDQQSLLLNDFTREDYLNIGKPYDSFNPLF